MDFERQIYEAPAGRDFDAVLIPGGGVRGDHDLPYWVKLRLERALELAGDRGIPIITLSAGSTHKVPPRDVDGWPLLEAVAMGRYLEARGYPDELIWPEAASYDTIGNAFFARTTHVDPAGLRRLLIITSTFHLPRTEMIFRWIFGLNPPSPEHELSFVDTPNTGMAPEVLHARIEKESQRIASLAEIIPKHRTLCEVHRWLFTEHSAYSIAAMHRREFARDRLLDSY